MTSPRKLLCDVCLVSMLFGVPAAGAANAPAAAPAEGPATQGSLLLEAGTGKVLTLSGSAANVFVADPKVAEVRPAAANSLFIFGVGAGHTTVAALDTEGHVLAQYDLTVQPSAFGANSAQAMISRLVPGSHVQVRAQQKGLLLTGSVESPQDAAQAVAIAKGYSGDTPNVDNELTITAPVQVTLNVRIAQMSRQVVRNLGINWQALGNIGKWAFAFATPASIASIGGAGALAANVTTGPGPNQFNATTIIDALAKDNLAHVLAEPNLTVMSGRSASFQVGGEYPVPVSQQNNTITVAYKNFGVMLNFLPTVLSDGRINLHVRPEVSQLSNQNSFQVVNGTTTLVVPSLTVSRAETTVELGSGQSFAIAGLLQQQTADNGQGLPGLGDIPVLGALFRSTAFDRTETELVIIVTPYIVRPVTNTADLHLPTDGYSPPSDLQRLLFMRQVADNQPPVPVRIPGDAGFIVQ